MEGKSLLTARSGDNRGRQRSLLCSSRVNDPRVADSYRVSLAKINLAAPCGPGPVRLHDGPGPRARDAMHGIARAQRQRAREGTLLCATLSKRRRLVLARLEIKVTSVMARADFN